MVKTVCEKKTAALEAKGKSKTDDVYKPTALNKVSVELIEAPQLK